MNDFKQDAYSASSGCYKSVASGWRRGWSGKPYQNKPLSLKIAALKSYICPFELSRNKNKV